MSLFQYWSAKKEGLSDPFGQKRPTTLLTHTSPFQDAFLRFYDSTVQPKMVEPS